MCDTTFEGKSESEIFVENEKLIDHTLKTYFKNNIGIFEYEDLRQEGAMGLVRAIRSYDAEESYFSTYAITCIRKAIRRYMEYNRFTVHVPPSHLNYALSQGEEATEELLSKCQTVPLEGMNEDCASFQIPIEPLWKQMGIESDALAKIQMQEIADVFNSELTKREREIMLAYIKCEANAAKAANMLNISKQRVRTVRNIFREKVRQKMIFEKDFE